MSIGLLILPPKTKEGTEHSDANDSEEPDGLSDHGPWFHCPDVQVSADAKPYLNGLSIWLCVWVGGWVAVVLWRSYWR